jgi:hypothetical protein
LSTAPPLALLAFCIWPCAGEISRWFTAQNAKHGGQWLLEISQCTDICSTPVNHSIKVFLLVPVAFEVYRVQLVLIVLRVARVIEAIVNTFHRIPGAEIDHPRLGELADFPDKTVNILQISIERSRVIINFSQKFRQGNFQLFQRCGNFRGTLAVLYLPMKEGAPQELLNLIITRGASRFRVRCFRLLSGRRMHRLSLYFGGCMGCLQLGGQLPLELANGAIPRRCFCLDADIPRQPIMQFIEQFIKVAFLAENAHLHITNMLNHQLSGEWRHDDRVGRFAESPGTAEFHQANWSPQEGLGDKFNHESGLLKGSLEVRTDVLPRRDAGCAARRVEHVTLMHATQNEGIAEKISQHSVNMSMT